MDFFIMVLAFLVFFLVFLSLPDVLPSSFIDSNVNMR